MEKMKKIEAELSRAFIGSFGWAEIEEWVKINALTYIKTGDLAALCQTVCHWNRDGDGREYSGDEVLERLRRIGILEKIQDLRVVYLEGAVKERTPEEEQEWELSRIKKLLDRRFMSTFGWAEIEARVKANALTYIFETADLETLREPVCHWNRDGSGAEYSGDEVIQKLEDLGLLEELRELMLAYQYRFVKV